MKKYLEIFRHSPLFDNISDTDLIKLFNCFSAKVKYYKKNDIIFSTEEKPSFIGFVLSGKVNILQDDFWGNRSILTCIEKGNMFAEAFVCAKIEQLPVNVVAIEDCEIMMIDYAKIMDICPLACPYHTTLIKNMIYILASKNVILTKKIEHTSKRSMREKVLSYLSAQAIENNNNKFTIPFDRQSLADYLAVDRSALSTELSKLRNEGILEFKKNAFELKNI